MEIVSSVSNGEAGVSETMRLKPDIIILDIEMPIMDGLTAIPLMRQHSPASKIIMFSSLTEKGAEATIKAFSLGAIECIAKPTSHSLRGKDRFFQDTLIHLIRSLMNRSLPSAHQPLPASESDAEPPMPKIVKKLDAVPSKAPPLVLAIGSSTGGPEALFKTTQHFSDLNIPIVITQHMPATFTKILAQHIEKNSNIPCCEGTSGMVLEAGKAYVAPGGFHMLFSKNEDGKVIIKIDDGPPVNFCKPAVDPMLFSLVESYGSRILSVILTGMGSDGAIGATCVANAGGCVIAQNKETSVVWGMPGATVEAGVCSDILPLDQIGPWVRKAIEG